MTACQSRPRLKTTSCRVRMSAATSASGICVSSMRISPTSLCRKRRIERFESNPFLGMPYRTR